MVRHVTFSGSGRPAAHRPLEPLPPTELLENKIALQAAEIEKLSADNLKLAASQVALRQETAAVQQEAHNVKAHIKSIQTESDIQIRVLLDKTAKMEADIKTGEDVKMELQQTHFAAQSLVNDKQELTKQIQQVSQELQKTCADLKKIPELYAELESLRKEHQRLRTNFQSEKGLNIDQVEQMKAMEKSLIGMATEVEKLRADVRCAVQRHGSIPQNLYGGHYMNSDPSYLTPIPGTNSYANGYGMPSMMPMGISHVVPYGGGDVSPLANVPDKVWGGPYDPSHA